MAIRFYDRAGNPMEFDGKKVLRVDTTDGGTRDFVHANLVEKAVELDFSGGDMEIEPAEGEVFTKIIIPTPANLIPENIPEGMDIAGIIGTLPAGRSAKFASGEFTGNGGAVTVTHGLGVVPDIFIVHCGIGLTSPATSKYLNTFFGVSAAFAEATSWTISKGIWYMMSTSSAALYYNSFGIRPIDYTYAGLPVNNANENTIVVGSTGTDGKTYPGTYKWFAIGGLT